MSSKPYIEALPGFWSRAAVMSRDDGPGGGGDGVLTKDELRGHIQRLAADRKRMEELGSPTYWIDAPLVESRQLLADMKDAGVDEIHYLPEELDGLPTTLRRRAVELLRHDDIGAMGEIDQFVIDHARDRYATMGGASLPTLGARTAALAEIDQIAALLGLE